MSTFPQADSTNERQHRRELAQGVRGALRGETYNTGKLDVASGTTSTALIDSRLGVGRVLLLSPLDSVAAGLAWHVSDMANGSATITHTSPGSDCLFGYVVIGIGG